ncbi:hypothetical protein [Sorangium sp. So ce341]|uniref:hypothetical protein n=1 Tax=Sorangium sp. So ce341 TaxID=3133302 RepID=UPI003F63D415
MKIQFASFAAAAIVAILSPLSGCSDAPEDPDDTSTSSSAAGSTSAASSGSGTGGSDSSGQGSGSVTSSASAGGTGGGDPGVAPTFETMKFVIQNASCFGAGCHNDEMNPLDLQIDAELRTRLVTHVSENCGNLPVVNPGKPEESALIKILKGPCGETMRMPLECVNDGDAKCVPPSYIEALSQWIADGALE